MTERLDQAELEAALLSLGAWRYEAERQALTRQFAFANFREAFGFITEVALVAERLDHHPEWSNVYRRVDIVLTTHSAGGVTRLDIEMANAIDGIARARG